MLSCLSWAEVGEINDHGSDLWTRNSIKVALFAGGEDEVDLISYPTYVEHVHVPVKHLGRLRSVAFERGMALLCKTLAAADDVLVHCMGSVHRAPPLAAAIFKRVGDVNPYVRSSISIHLCVCYFAVSFQLPRHVSCTVGE
jgi:hypothetical protein